MSNHPWSNKLLKLQDEYKALMEKSSVLGKEHFAVYRELQNVNVGYAMCNKEYARKVTAMKKRYCDLSKQLDKLTKKGLMLQDKIEAEKKLLATRKA